MVVELLVVVAVMLVVFASALAVVVLVFVVVELALVVVVYGHCEQPWQYQLPQATSHPPSMVLHIAR